MARLTRRLQVLLDEPRFARLEAEAQMRETTMAALVRESLDRAFPPGELSARAAGEGFLDRPPVDLGEWDELKAEIERALVRASNR